MTKKTCLSIVMGFMLFGITGTSNATLMGDSVNGAILLGIGTSIVQFDPQTVTVDASVEFTGQWLYSVFSEVWDVNVDIKGTAFDVSVSENTSGNNNIYDGVNMFGIQLTDLDWNGQVGGITSVDKISGVDNAISTITTTDNSVTIWWESFPFGAGNLDPNGGTWSFAINQSQSVPDPVSSLLLFGFGILGIAGLRKRFK
jgi:hypothetical protein